MGQKRKNFFIVGNDIFSQGLKPRDIAVYCCICRHINAQTGVAFVSRQCIAKECGIGKTDTADKALHVLCEKGLIIKRHQYSEEGGYKSNVYSLGSQ